MFCKKCGNQIMDDAVVCVHCGCPTDKFDPDPQKNQDKSSVNVALISFFLPLVGLVIYLVYKDNQPLKAESAKMGTIWGFFLPIIIILLVLFVSGMMAFIFMNT